MLGHNLFILGNYFVCFHSLNNLDFLVYYRIEGSTGVELASGLHWYLKYWCGAHISWDKTGGIQVLSVPPPNLLPLVEDGGIVIKRPVPWSYYQNVVTSSCKFLSFSIMFLSCLMIIHFKMAYKAKYRSISKLNTKQIVKVELNDAILKNLYKARKFFSESKGITFEI